MSDDLNFLKSAYWLFSGARSAEFSNGITREAQEKFTKRPPPGAQYLVKSIYYKVIKIHKKEKVFRYNGTEWVLSLKKCPQAMMNQKMIPIEAFNILEDR